jgi:hypothetical protein
VAKTRFLYCATDKEIYDALASTPLHFSESTLLGLAKTRGIFYSPLADRMQLCSDISLLIFGFNEVAHIEAEFEKSARTERKTFKNLKAALTLEEFRTIADQYQSEAEKEGDTVSCHNVGTTQFGVNVEYEEVDFSKTRLRQRQRRKASIEFKVQNGETTISYPANEKVRHIVEGLIERAKEEKKEQIPIDEVDLSWITTFDLRTKFFQELIRKVPGFTLDDVTHVQVDFGNPVPDDADLLEDAEDEKKAAEEEIVGVVRDIALHGKALHLSEEYKRLKEKGFFLTSIHWAGRRNASPHEIVQFDAGFDNPAAGVGYRYGVRTWRVPLESGQLPKSWTTIPAEEKAQLSSLLQHASMAVYLEIKKEFNQANSNGEPL